MQEPEIQFDILDGLGRILLNRPKALNALTIGKIREMDRTLRSWAADPGVKAVLIEGAGDRAFCAGGDIRALSDAAKAGDDATIGAFFREEYTLNRLIKTYPKPYLAVLNGITMGGGVGISVHGSHRIATETTVFAMPETGIGMIPDVGGTYALPRCPGAIGMYLGLTGHRLRADDCLYAGLATHRVPMARRGDLEDGLRAALPGADTPDAVRHRIDAVLADLAEPAGAPPLAAHRADIDRVFGLDGVAAMLAALDAMGPGWGADTAAVLRAKAPTALAVAVRQLRQGRDLDFDACMQLEYRLVRRITRAPDFVEGVRAVILDKDNTPRWTPDRLEAVDPAAVDAYFAPLADEDDLRFD
ncbi:enoyl-CoA hydratase/isomerase family protein [Roseospira goensis]|uniref:3-hydroxyisobutyryl-CoA hydrolase n=1 Tax=Roseospira goensis TaxID=391922 RepID=A0A7W6RYQ8_9PROT|nr:enoyl-CoA hydratase/isomerase family protein [Roseospira goensis]MBB4285054.1 enoyl-CoA hydratase [Roseospira goensis]